METIKLKEWLEIRKTVTVLISDKISVVHRKYSNWDIWMIMFNIEVIRALLTEWSDEKILDDIIKSELTEDVIDEMTKWGEIVTDIMEEMEKWKKKSKEQSGNIKKQWKANSDEKSTEQ